MTGGNLLANSFCSCGVDWNKIVQQRKAFKLSFPKASPADFLKTFLELISAAEKSVTLLEDFPLEDIFDFKYICNDSYPSNNLEKPIVDFNEVAKFCFPVRNVSLRVSNQHTKRHFFMMTNELDKKYYGSCVRFFDEVSKDRIDILRDISLFDILDLKREKSIKRNSFLSFLEKKSPDLLLYFHFIVKTYFSLIDFKGNTNEQLEKYIDSSDILRFSEILSLASILEIKDMNSTSLIECFIYSWKFLEENVLSDYKAFRFTLSPAIYEEKAICLISKHGYFNTLSEVLITLVSLVQKNRELPLPLERIISHIAAEIPEPPPGKLKVIFKLFKEDEVTFSCMRPPINKLPLFDLPLKPLFESLCCQNLLTVISALLIERKIIISSSSLYKVSCVMLAFSKLIFPLRLETPFIPILPETMLEVLNSPFPVFVGIHSSLVSSDNFLDKNVVFVNLDDDTVEVSFGNEIPQPPPEALGRLVRSLKKKVYGDSLLALSTQEGSFKQFGSLCAADDREFNERVREIFMLYMVDILKDYRQCLDGITSSEIEFFDRDLFVKSHKETGVASEYLVLFASTQMIQLFCEERIFLPERNLEVMLFDSWIDKHTKRAGYEFNSYFLDDSSQDIVAEYSVDSPSKEDYSSQPCGYRFKNIFEWSIVPSPLGSNKFHNIRRGSHLVRNIKKVSQVLESVYLSFYTKRTIYGAKFKLIMKQVTASCNELNEIVQFVDQLSASFVTFLSRIKHKNAEKIKDDTGSLQDRDRFMHSTIWPNYLRAEKAWVSILEGYSHTILEKILRPLHEMLRKLTNEKRILSKNGKHWFSKVEETKIDVENLKIQTQKADKAVELLKKELEEAHVDLTRHKGNTCNDLQQFTSTSYYRQLQRRMVNAIVDSEKSRMSFAERIAFLNRELNKFSESLSDIFRSFMLYERKRKKNLQNILGLLAEISYDFFLNLQTAVDDSLGNATKDFDVSNDLEMKEKAVQDSIEVLMSKEEYTQKLYLDKYDDNGFLIDFPAERIEMDKLHILVPYLYGESYIRAKADFPYLDENLLHVDIIWRAESIFEDYRAYVKQVRNIYKVILERAEIRAQAYSSLASTLLQFVPTSKDDSDARSSLLPYFIKRYSSSSSSPTLVRNMSKSLSVRMLEQLKVSFALFGRLLMESAVPSVENEIVFFSKETSFNLREVTRREVGLKNQLRRKVQNSSRALDKSFSTYERDQHTYKTCLTEYAEAYSEKHGYSYDIEEDVKVTLQKVILNIEITSSISVQSDLMRMDKKLSKLHHKCVAHNELMASSRRAWIACVAALQMSERAFVSNANISLRILQFQDSFRVISTTRALSSYHMSFNNIFQQLHEAFEADKVSILSYDFDDEFNANRALTNKLEQFSNSLFNAYYRRGTQDDGLYLDEGDVVSDTEKSYSFVEGVALSEYSSCPDDPDVLCFATCMKEYFPTIVLYFNEFELRLRAFHAFTKSFYLLNYKLWLDLKKARERLGQLWPDSAAGCVLGCLHNGLIIQIEDTIQNQEERAENSRSVKTKIWFLRKQMSKVLIVHSQRKKRLDELLQESEAHMEKQTTRYLNSEKKLDEFENTGVKRRKLYRKYPCLPVGVSKHKYLFHLRNSKEIDYIEMCNAEEDLVMKSDTYDDCLSQMLQRLESNLNMYFTEFVTIVDDFSKIINISTVSDGNRYFDENSISSHDDIDIELMDETLYDSLASHKKALKQLDIRIEYLKDQESACRTLSAFFRQRINLFAKFKKAVDIIVERFINKCSTFSLMTNESSSVANCLDKVTRRLKDRLGEKDKSLNQLTIKCMKSLKLLTERTLFIQNQIQTNSRKILKNLCACFEKYVKAKKSKTITSQQLQKLQQNLLDAEIQAKSELQIVNAKFKKYVEVKRLEVTKIYEVCSGLESSNAESLNKTNRIIKNNMAEINTERDVQLFIEWHGKPLSSTKSAAIPQMFSFHT